VVSGGSGGSGDGGGGGGGWVAAARGAALSTTRTLVSPLEWFVLALAFLAVVGPGLIAGVAGNDAGGITTYATLGSSTGLRFLWILPFTALLSPKPQNPKYKKNYS
jgi:hypothetical protein